MGPGGLITHRLARGLAWGLVGAVVFVPLIALVVLGVERLPTVVELAGKRTSGLLLRSVTLALASTAVAMILGGAAAISVETLHVAAGARRWLRSLAVLPVLLPPYYQVAAWRPVLDPWLTASAVTRTAITVGLLGVALAPAFFFFASHGLRQLSADVVESAIVHGCSRRQLVFGVIIPLIRPALLTGATLVFLMALLNYEVPVLLFLNVYPDEILVTYQSTADVGAAAVSALPLVLVSVGVVLVFGRLFGGLSWTVLPTARRATSQLSLGSFSWIGSAGFLALFAGVPIGRLVTLAWGDGIFSVAGRVLLLYGPELMLSLATSIGAALFAVLLAFGVVDRSGLAPRFLGGIIWAPLAVPGALLGAALIRVYNAPVVDLVYGSPVILIVAAVARFFPVAYYALAAHLRSVPQEYWEHADLTPCSECERLFKVTVPLAWPGITLAISVFLLLQIGELAAAVLVAPPGARPVALIVYSLLHYNNDLEVPAMLCLLQLVAVLVVIALLQVVRRRG